MCLITGHGRNVTHLRTGKIAPFVVDIISAAETIPQVVVLLDGVGVWPSVSLWPLLCGLSWHEVAGVGECVLIVSVALTLDVGALTF